MVAQILCRKTIACKFRNYNEWQIITQFWHKIFELVSNISHYIKTLWNVWTRKGWWLALFGVDKTHNLSFTVFVLNRYLYSRNKGEILLAPCQKYWLPSLTQQCHVLFDYPDYPYKLNHTMTGPLDSSYISCYCYFIECSHMMTWWPYWRSQTKKQRPYSCIKPVLWELNSSFIQTYSFVSINQYDCFSCEWKLSIFLFLLWLSTH